MSGNIKLRTSLHGNIRGSKIYPALEDLNIIPSGKKQTFTHSNSYGYDLVTVEPVASEVLDVNPSFEKQKFEGLFNTINVESMKVPIEQWYREYKDYWDGTIITDLTPEQVEALQNMTLNSSSDLVLEYDEEILDINFVINEGNLIVENNVEGLDFYINEKKELEAIY